MGSASRLDCDLFCRVVDNYGDAGVCWRLACALAARGWRVRLWIDDPTPLGWMAPGGQAGVDVAPFDSATQAVPGGLVIEAFGCDPPPAFAGRMAQASQPPIWINLEYLSAEGWVERCHGLRSPQLSGPGAGLAKWFFYPGFSAATGGLLRPTAPPPANGRAWLAQQDWAARPDELSVLLFCYPNAGIAPLLQRLAGTGPVQVLAAPGPAQQGLAGLKAASSVPSNVRVVALPWLDQARFDTLLQATDMNLVRGEDSFVQAQWSGAPFVWHAYVQDDGVHADKVNAFLDRHLAGYPDTATATAVRSLWQAWNGLGAWPDALPAPDAWRAGCTAWRDSLLAQPSLANRLLAFIERVSNQAR